MPTQSLRLKHDITVERNLRVLFNQALWSVVTLEDFVNQLSNLKAEAEIMRKHTNLIST
jgi:hypothetical protein